MPYIVELLPEVREVVGIRAHVRGATPQKGLDAVLWSYKLRRGGQSGVAVRTRLEILIDLEPCLPNDLHAFLRGSSVPRRVACNRVQDIWSVLHLCRIPRH